MASESFVSPKQAYLQAVAARVDSLGSRCVHVLEAGVGAGYTAVALHGILGPQHRLIAVDRDTVNLQRFDQQVGNLANGPDVQLVTADACDLSKFDDESVDLVCSDTMLHMLGYRFALWFSEVHRILRPGGAFMFRELLPPTLPLQTRRDLFFQLLITAKRLNGDEYEMIPVPVIEHALAELGFVDIEVHHVTESDDLEFRLEQWHPFSNQGCPLRDQLINYFETRRLRFDDGLPLSTSYHVACGKSRLTTGCS